MAQDNALAAAATNTLGNANNQAAKLAEQMGQRAAEQLISQVQSGNLPEFMKQSTPGIPAPQVMPPTQANPRIQSEIGGGSDNYGLRVAHDQGALINEVSTGVKAALGRHKEEEVRKATMDYSILMGSIQALQRLDPKDPKNAADISHNQRIVSSFFEDEKKVKRLEKIMGFDAFDAKAEQKKQADPHYQAFQQAASQVSNNAPTGQTQQVPVQNNQAQNEPGWMQNIPDNAKRFMRQFPSTPPNPLAQYQLQGELVKSGVYPSADKIAETNNIVLKGKMDLQQEFVKSSTEIEKEKMIADARRYTANMDAASSERVALINLQGTRLAASVKELELRQKQGELDLGGYEKMLAATKGQYDLARERYGILSKAKEAGSVNDEAGWKKDIDQAQSDLSDSQKGYNQTLENVTEYMKGKGYNTTGLGKNFKVSNSKADDIINSILVPSSNPVEAGGKLKPIENR